MRAVGFWVRGEDHELRPLLDIDAPEPDIGSRDLLVEIRAVSVNPVDIKLRSRPGVEDGLHIPGFDAAGVVLETGPEVTLFSPGDEVYYAGDITRPGTCGARHAVDERIVGRKPQTLSFLDAAALPLTAITAWELLFDSFGIPEGGGEGESLLVIGGAGGVGSILTQIARQMTKLKVIATASRPETADWCRRMGANHVVDHRKSLAEQLRSLGIEPRYVGSLTATDRHFEAVTELVKPRGEIAVIDDASGLDMMRLKPKSLSFHLEFMFTRPIFGTDDMIIQHKLLDRVAGLVDAGLIRSTANHHGGGLSAATLTAAHDFQQRGLAIGKTVLEGLWSNL